MKSPTICIDLGASYTKVGFRPECTPAIGAPFDHEASVLLVDGNPLIPSLAVQTKGSDSRWLFGMEAADYRPAAGSVVHTNWKSGLYQSGNDGQAAHAAVIAEKFFSWLKGKLTPFVNDWAFNRVRITLPAFANGKNLEAVVRKCLDLADWNPGEIEITTEPHANAIGLMTVGRNIVTRGRDGVFVDFGSMFGQGNPYIRTARSAILGSAKKKFLRVAVIDIGAFTTDLAILEFNVATLGSSDDGLSALEQESFPVGTHDFLDNLFWKRLHAEHGDFIDRLTFAEKEELKRRIFVGEEYSVTIEGMRMRFGSAGDVAAASQSAYDFSTKVWNDIKRTFSAANADVVYLTGGGSKIESVADQLAKNISNIATQPAVAMHKKTSGTGWKNWRSSGEGLDRLATAIGGVSVIGPQPLSAVNIGLKLRDRLEPSFQADRPTIKSCTCHGNPDCPLCKGSGYINVS